MWSNAITKLTVQLEHLVSDVVKCDSRMRFIVHDR